MEDKYTIVKDGVVVGLANAPHHERLKNLFPNATIMEGELAPLTAKWDGTRFVPIPPKDSAKALAQDLFTELSALYSINFEWHKLTPGARKEVIAYMSALNEVETELPPAPEFLKTFVDAFIR